MQNKKIPMRMCLGCKEMKPKKELIRVVKTKDNEIKLDVTGKVAGRGAYLCYDGKCLEKAIKSKAIDRALSVTIPEDIYNGLREGIKIEK